MSLLKSNLVHGAGGFLMMGSWAAFANRDHPWPAPLQAALVQGVLTAGITLVLKRIVEAILERHPGKVWLAPLAAAAFSALMLASVHLLAGTPAFWTTVAVPFTVATCYSALYARRLRHG